MPDLLAEAARANPNASCLEFGTVRLTFAQMEAWVVAVAELVQQQGWQSGIRVALALPNTPVLLAFLTACSRLGILACPLNPREPEAMRNQRLAQLGTAHLLDASHPLVAQAEKLCLEVAPIKAGRVTPRPIPSEQPTTVIFTSGSTGTPKAVALPYRAHVYSAEGVNAAVELRAGDRWLLDLPLYHVGGLAIWYRCLMARATVVLRDPAEDRLVVLRSSAITHASMVAAQLRWVLDAGLSPPATLRHVLLGGSAIARSLLGAAKAAGWPVHTSYGMTEMASTITMTPTHPEPHHGAGQPLAHRQIVVGLDGRLGIGGRTAMLGFIEEGQLVPTLDAGGIWWTRDLGTIDKEGNVHITGRIDNMFISGGENVQPEHIEQAVLALDGMRRAVVVPVSDVTWGARPVVFVEPLSLAETDAMQAHLAERLPKWQRPVAWHAFPDENPEQFKVNRTFLQAWAEKSRGAD